MERISLGIEISNDPYSLPDRAFEEVLEVVEESTDGLIAELLR